MSNSFVVTTNLQFVCAERAALPRIQRDGIQEDGAIYFNLDDARRSCSECILVLDGSATEASSNGAISTPVNAIQNLSPYADPRPVTAAGGILTRGRTENPEILLILRRGIWDLPKGKLDAGEEIEECAIREVCEEVGIDDVAITAPLGQTIHGYRDGAGYAVKTTHWFAMCTDAVDFDPQRKEQIEEVKWVPLSEARERMGFATLRRHLAAVDAILRTSAAAGRC